MTRTAEHFHLDIAVLGSYPSAARHQFATWLCDNSIPPEVLDTWQLVFSELLSNAYRCCPAWGTIHVDAVVNDDRIKLEVHNPTETMEVPRVQHHPDPLSPTGRGLAIIQHLTDGLLIKLADDGVQVICWQNR